MIKEYTKEDVKGDCLYCKHIKQRGTYGGKCVNENGICYELDIVNWEWNGSVPNYDYINFSNDDWIKNRK